MSRPLSRILLLLGITAVQPATIHLGQPLPTGSCDLPADHRAGRSTARIRRNGSFLILLQVGFT